MKDKSQNGDPTLRLVSRPSPKSQFICQCNRTSTRRNVKRAEVETIKMTGCTSSIVQTELKFYHVRCVWLLLSFFNYTHIRRYRSGAVFRRRPAFPMFWWVVFEGGKAEMTVSDMHFHLHNGCCLTSLANGFIGFIYILYFLVWVALISSRITEKVLLKGSRFYVTTLFIIVTAKILQK